MQGYMEILTMAEDEQIGTDDSMLKRPDFRERKSTESKCNKTVVDHITQISVEYHIHTTIILEYIKCGIT